jgi:hypothetical protein
MSTELFVELHRHEFILIIILVCYVFVTNHIQLNDNYISVVVCLLLYVYYINYRPSHPILLGCIALVIIHICMPGIINHIFGISSSSSNLPPFLQQLNRIGPQTMTDQFPYTLEQEVISKMAPILTTSSGSSMFGQSYVPVADNTHNAIKLADRPPMLVPFQ